MNYYKIEGWESTDLREMAARERMRERKNEREGVRERERGEEKNIAGSGGIRTHAIEMTGA